ncbi:DNA-3-methyladenine glycosylase I [Vagococcus acidifermentans]|uniref:DNA-3-methyladenine glycosylase n=1 Tax=Vagococcus acidifermentans TaxID=564710 RepID=A0A430ALZ9_9ENTE|nr:DNA-3-methyladenine glycosylase I [Vagococcus acidifermentans]RSU09096.1 DNA-3-methyladenine glycosylase [Vagococcus acidifermentans]
MTTDNRCGWAVHPLEIQYHDSDWGIPKKDDYTLFYMLILEGMQAGLSWLTILKKWPDFFEAFDQFDIELVAAYDEDKKTSLLANKKIIRNRRKINAAVENARCFKSVQEEYGSFADYLWGYVNHTPIQNYWKSMTDIPAHTPLSEKISHDLKARGFQFVGPTIIYAYMQSVGMVNDHLVSCPCHETVKHF